MYAVQVLELDLIHQQIHFWQSTSSAQKSYAPYYPPPLTYMRSASYSLVIKSYTYARLWSNNFTHLSPLDLFNFPHITVLRFHPISQTSSTCFRIILKYGAKSILLHVNALHEKIHTRCICTAAK